MPNILDQFKLDGRIALITGSSGGIGEGLARGLADAGAHVGQIMDSSQPTFFLSYWVRERARWQLEEAVRRLTSDTADIVIPPPPDDSSDIALPPPVVSSDIPASVIIEATVGADTGPERLESIPLGSNVVLSVTNPNSDDEFHLHDREVYWLCHGKMSDSNVWGRPLDKALGAHISYRGKSKDG